MNLNFPGNSCIPRTWYRLLFTISTAASPSPLAKLIDSQICVRKDCQCIFLSSLIVLAFKAWQFVVTFVIIAYFSGVFLYIFYDVPFIKPKGCSDLRQILLDLINYRFTVINYKFRYLQITRVFEFFSKLGYKQIFPFFD